MLMNVLAALRRDDDDDKPRPPPPSATPLDFPCCEPKSTEPANRVPQRLYQIFGEIKKGPTKDHVHALNACLNGNTPVEELVPAEHLPPRSWLQAPSQSKEPTDQPVLLNGGSLPAHETFHVRARELQISNEDGYRTLRRVPLAGEKGAIRLLFFRKFWEELDSIADYWDTSQDKYTKPRSSSHNGSSNAAIDLDELRDVANKENDIKGQHDQPSKGDMEMQAVQTNPNAGTISLGESQIAQSQSNTSTSNAPSSSRTTDIPEPSTENDTDEDLYTGRRTSTGSLMPSLHRERCLFSFIETLALPFRLRLAEPRTQPKLQLGRLLIPTPHMASIQRVPLDQAQARQGLREGPVMGVVAAEYTKWREDGEERGEGGQERLHILKEIGCILLLAQRRAREGTEEDVPGKGRWWAETPKWGGGSGVAVFKEPVNEGGRSARSTTGEGAPSLIEAQRRRVKRARRGWYEEEQKPNQLVPPSSLWERNVRYARVGMDRRDGNEYDDIYLISSVNHHISIIRAQVHTKYIQHITCGGDVTEQRKDWYKLEMQRSKWYDLLDPGDRIEAMRGIWAIMNWMMRDIEESS